MMKRADLLTTLNTLKPALANNDLIPALSMFWFRDGKVMAFNDQIAIQLPMPTDFAGALHGGTLISMLNTSMADEVELSVGASSSANVKLGKTKLKLAHVPEEDLNFFSMPRSVKNDLLVVEPEPFLIGIESCLRSIGTDVAVPDQLGITIIRKGNKLILYSTDRLTLSRAEVGFKEEPPLDDGERIILSALFCKQMLKLLKWRSPARYVDDDEGEGETAEEVPQNQKGQSNAPSELHLEIADKHALLTVGGSTLYGRLLRSERPLDYEGIYQSHVSDKILKGLVPMPDNLGPILNRAEVIVRTSEVPTGMQIDVEEVSNGKRATFHAKTGRGEVTDTLKLDDNHPEVAVTMTPKLMRRGCDFFDELLITSKIALFKRGKLTYLVSKFSSN